MARIRRTAVTAIATAFILIGTGVAAVASVPSTTIMAGGVASPAYANKGDTDVENGRWIAYQSPRLEHQGIWLIRPNGRHDHEVALDAPGWRLLPDWSPDGKRLAFVSRSEQGELIYEYDLATKRSRPLFACSYPCLGDDEPVYSPDGRNIAFIRYLGPIVNDLPADCSLWIGNRTTGKVRQITSNLGTGCDREYYPRWSPDGTRLTYWRDPYVDGQPSGTAVFTIRADGTGERRLTDPAMFAGSPTWSPDGRWIVFSTYPLLEFQCCKISNLYRIRPDGTHMQKLTHFPTEELRAGQPRYTPNGKHIVFTAVTPTTRNLWLIPANGGRAKVLTHGGPFPDFYTHGTWQPRRSR